MSNLSCLLHARPSAIKTKATAYLAFNLEQAVHLDDAGHAHVKAKSTSQLRFVSCQAVFNLTVLFASRAVLKPSETLLFSSTFHLKQRAIIHCMLALQHMDVYNPTPEFNYGHDVFLSGEWYVCHVNALGNEQLSCLPIQRVSLTHGVFST